MASHESEVTTLQEPPTNLQAGDIIKIPVHLTSDYVEDNEKGGKSPCLSNVNDSWKTSSFLSQGGNSPRLAKVNDSSWKTASFWSDQEPLYVPLPTSIDADVSPPYTEVPGGETKAEMLKQQAEEFKKQAAMLEVQSQYLMQAAYLKNQEQPFVVPDVVPVSECQTQDAQTTVMIANIPNNITREDLIQELANNSLHCYFDFLYLPMDFEKDANLGYAFVNLVSEEAAKQVFNVFNNYANWGCNSNKITEVKWGTTQVLEKHVERYRNSPVMHEEVPDTHKPVFYYYGQRYPFPVPTKRVRRPQQREKGVKPK
jgi:hypothetical protein